MRRAQDGRQDKNGHKISKTYNTEDSPVVTDLSTSSAISSVSRGERTGSRAFYYVWSYVLFKAFAVPFLSRLVCGCCDGWLQHGGWTTRQPSAPPKCVVSGIFGFPVNSGQVRTPGLIGNSFTLESMRTPFMSFPLGRHLLTPGCGVRGVRQLRTHPRSPS